MKKNFVLDTNVLLHDAGALYAFEDNNLCIPIYVFEEIDQFKKDLSELGRNAREVSRIIDGFREKGSLRDGVSLESGGTLRVLLTNKKLPPEASVRHEMDNSIMACALDIKEREPEHPCVFVTKDTNLRIRADALGLDAVDFDVTGGRKLELYPETIEFTLTTECVDAIYEGNGVPLTEAGDVPLGMYPNEYLLVRDASRPSRTILARLDSEGERIEKIHTVKDSVWGIRPRNMEQHFALDALLRPEVQMVTLVGKAGTGKTLVALAAGLQQTVDDERYRKMLVSRPIFPLGRDIGFLPGDLEEKLRPWMQPIHDNVEFLTSLSRGNKHVKNYRNLIDNKIIEIEALTYIRGRSIPQQFIIVDEAQNLTPHEVKTVLTRAGESTKLVFTGDPHQIDHPYVDAVNNGLTYLAQKFRNESIAAHVVLTKGERSPLAEIASNLL